MAGRRLRAYPTRRSLAGRVGVCVLVGASDVAGDEEEVGVEEEVVAVGVWLLVISRPTVSTAEN